MNIVNGKKLNQKFETFLEIVTNRKYIHDHETRLRFNCFNYSEATQKKNSNIVLKTKTN